MSNQFTRQDSNQIPFRVALRDAILSVRTLNTAILIYACILTIIAGQIHIAYLLTSITLASLLFPLYFIKQHKWNNSEEFRSTLPVNPQIIRKADRFAAFITVFPFYSISLLALKKNVLFYGEMAYPNIYFILEALIALLIYTLAYKWALNGKELSSSQAPIFKNLRYLSASIAIVITATFLIAVQKNKDFYKFPEPYYIEKQVAFPKSFLETINKQNYQAEKPDKVLLIASVLQGGQHRIYSSAKTIDLPADGRFSINFTEFNNAPPIFKYLSAESKGDQITLEHNGSLKTKGLFSQPSSRTLSFRNGTFPRRAFSLKATAPIFNFANKDPWYRRLFSLYKQSFNMDQLTVLYCLPYNSSEQLIPTDLSKSPQTDYYGYISSQRLYFRKSLESSQRYFKSLDKNTGYGSRDEHIAPHNFLLPLLGMYTALVTLFLSLCFATKTKFLGILSSLLLTLSLHAFCDYSLLQNRIQTINNEGTSNFLRSFAAMDLHNTVLFRSHAEKEVLKTLSKRPHNISQSYSSKDARLSRYLRYSALNLLDQDLKVYNREHQSFRIFSINRYISHSGHRFLSPNNDIFISHKAAYPFTLKLAQKPGFYITGSTQLFHFKGFEVNNLKLNQRIPGIVKTIKALQKNKHSQAQLNKLKTNDELRFSLLCKLFNERSLVKGSTEELRKDIVSVNLAQQIKCIQDNIKSITIREY